MLYTCQRCGANIPRSTALSGDVARCPECYAPYRLPDGANGPAFGTFTALVLCLAVLGGLVFAAGTIFVAGTSAPAPSHAVLSEEEFNEREALMMQQNNLQPPPQQLQKKPGRLQGVEVQPPLGPIGEEVQHAVELSLPRRIGQSLTVRYRVLGNWPLLLLQEPTLVVRYGKIEKYHRLDRLPGGDYTFANAIPAGFKGKVEIYFTATWDQEPGADRISNVVSVQVNE